MIANEFFYSPLFLLAVNAILAAGIILAVRRLRTPLNQQVQQVQDPYEGLRSVINSEVRERAAYVIKVGRAVMGELVRIRDLGLGKSSTLREAVRAFAAYSGDVKGLEEFAAVFEKVRYGGQVPSDEEVVKFKAAAHLILENLYRTAPTGRA